MDCLFRQNNIWNLAHKSNSVPKSQWEEGDEAPFYGNSVPSQARCKMPTSDQHPMAADGNWTVGSSAKQHLLGAPREWVASALHPCSSPRSLCQLSSPGPGQCWTVHPFYPSFRLLHSKERKIYENIQGKKKRAGLSNSLMAFPVVVVFYTITSHTACISSPSWRY